MESFIEVLEYLRTQVAPEVLKTGAQITFWNSLASFAYTILFTTFSYPAHYSYKKFLDALDDYSDGKIILWFVSTVVFACMFVFGICMAFNVWMWVGIFNPELAFARELFVKVFGG